MTETGNNSINQFNPVFDNNLHGSSTSRDKTYKPVRIEDDMLKYHYVVDWQIEDDEEGEHLNWEKNPYGW